MRLTLFGLWAMSETSGKRTLETAASPRLPLRQRSLLALLRALGGKVGKQDFQKLLFLYTLHCRQSGVTPPYDFVPHSYGAFSFTAAADREKLVRRKILADDEWWQLTSDGSRVAANFANRNTTVFALRNRKLTGDALVAETYRRSPYHASRSRIVDRVLEDDPATRNLIATEESVRSVGPLITIGYERRSYEDYFNELLQCRVTRLCDVRRNPVSRKWGFSKRTLSDGCRQLGIEYEALPELGIASARRANLNGRSSHDLLFAHYESTTLQTSTDALDRILAWIQAGERVAITCYERNPAECHRSRLVKALAARSPRSLLPRHL